MRPRSDLGNDSTKSLVQFGLCRNDARTDAQFLIDDSRSRFITRGFQGQQQASRQAILQNQVQGEVSSRVRILSSSANGKPHHRDLKLEDQKCKQPAE